MRGLSVNNTDKHPSCTQGACNERKYEVAEKPGSNGGCRGFSAFLSSQANPSSLNVGVARAGHGTDGTES
jgi:hypothetical protein